MSTLITIGTLPCPIEKINIIAEDSLAALKKYVLSKNWDQHLKDLLISDKFIRQNHTVYLHYPLLFNEAFNFHDKEVLTKLSIAGFFCFNSINMLDDIFDSQNHENIFERYHIANLINEEAIKLLSSIFPIESKFWDLWALRQKEFSNAYQKNKFSKEKIKNIEDYEVFAEEKSTYAKAAIDALYILSNSINKEDIYISLLDSHKYFSILFQVSDDLKDIISDLENGQFNILNFYLREKNIDGWSSKKIKTALYENGIISKYSLYGVLQGAKAQEYVAQKPLNYWKYIVQRLSNMQLLSYLNLSGYIKEFEIKNKLKNDFIPIEQNLAESSIKRGLTFLFNEQEHDGSWQDYFNNAGVSDTWTTAFVLSTLPSKFFSIYKKEVEKALCFLELKKQPGKGWGYNSFWMPDADSTTFSLLAFCNFKNESMDANTFNYWLRHQNDDGGIATYFDKNAVQVSIDAPLADVEGWTQSHLCVSSAAYYFMTQCDNITKTTIVPKLKDYIISCFENNKICSYWWTSPIYSLYFLLKGSLILNDKKIADFCINYLKNEYLNKENLPSIVNENNFYAGLLLSCISTSETLQLQFTEKANTLADMLLKNQKSDGSWDSGYSLRIPSPQILNPELKSIVWKKDNKGVNCIFEDFHRIFTTVVCTSAIYEFSNVKKQTQLLDTTM